MEKKNKEKGRQLWFRILLFLLPRLVAAYGKLIDLTCRVVILNQEVEHRVCKRQPFVCACFHGTMLFPVQYCQRYPGVIMVSRSRDGELIDRCLRRWGFDTVRGSSSNGGKDALAEMIRVIQETNCHSGLAVDAPRGPALQVKMGIVLLARDTGNPVVPLVSWATRMIRFNSWDRMILPLPFSTIVLAFGQPTQVPRGLGRDDYEQVRQGIEDSMHRASRQAQDAVEAEKMKKGRLQLPRTPGTVPQNR